MKNFQDKLFKINLLLFIFITSCNTCNKYSFSDFKKNIEVFKKVKNIIIKDNSENKINLEALSKKIESKDYQTLRELSLKNIQVFQDVIVFKFSEKSNDNFVEKKMDTALSANTTNKDCNYYLFYYENVDNLNKVISYPQYTECRKEFKEINKHWVYSSQIWYCAD